MTGPNPMHTVVESGHPHVTCRWTCHRHTWNAHRNICTPGCLILHQSINGRLTPRVTVTCIVGRTQNKLWEQSITVYVDTRSYKRRAGQLEAGRDDLGHRLVRVVLEHKHKPRLAGGDDARALCPAVHAELRPCQQVLKDARWRVHCAAMTKKVLARRPDDWHGHISPELLGPGCRKAHVNAS